MTNRNEYRPQPSGDACWNTPRCDQLLKYGLHSLPLFGWCVPEQQVPSHASCEWRGHHAKIHFWYFNPVLNLTFSSQSCSPRRWTKQVRLHFHIAACQKLQTSKFVLRPPNRQSRKIHFSKLNVRFVKRKSGTRKMDGKRDDIQSPKHFLNEHPMDAF